MIEKKSMAGLRSLLILCVTAAALLGFADALIPDTISRFSWEPSNTGVLLSIAEENPPAVTASTSSYQSVELIESTAQAKLFGIIPLKNINVKVYNHIRLYPGGMPFGVKLFTEGLMVVGMADVDCENGSKTPAYDAGIRISDIILSVNGTSISSAEEFVRTVEGCDGTPIEVHCRREQEEFTAQIQPSLSVSEQKYKTGMWVRDSTAGIGTITFINPENNTFAGLGHGICDVDTGELMPLMRGVVVDVSLSGITKGVAGSPGELKGYFSSGKIGALIGNSDSGVYGALLSCPSTVPEEALPIALNNEISEGAAYIWCTVENGPPQKYTVEISSIRRGSSDNKNFVVQITDPVLLSKTGGIVQGMSGSPIIQNGKLVGAVTHVLINDPTKGYGIFIENMLTAME